jgi:pilus assembly protein CpaB
MNRRIGLVVIAVVLAAIGAVAVYSYAHNADKRAVAKTRSTTVLYAQRQVPVGMTWGAAVKGSYFKQEKVPVDSSPTSALASTDVSIPLDYVATSDIGAGQIAVREMFGERQAKTGILAIPKGMQAVTVSLQTNADVAGFVQNGSEIAVYGTFKVKGGDTTAVKNGTFGGANNGDPQLVVTKLLLARASVIAASQGAPSDLNGPNNATQTSNNNSDTILVTLALNQADSERIILAQATGQLYLSLLSSDSVTNVDGGTLNVGIFQPKPIFSQ